MRIAIFTNAYKPAISGVVTSIALFREGLAERGHEAHIFAPSYEGYEDEEAYIFRFPALDLSRQINAALVWPFRNLIEPALRGVKPALIHSQHPLWMGDFAAGFARDLGIPLVFTFHSQYEKYAQVYSPLAPQLAERITEQLIGRYLKGCAHLIVPTESVREHVLANYDVEAGVSVVPTPVDLERFRPHRPQLLRRELLRGGDHLLLYIGRMAKEKGLDMLLQTFAQIEAKVPGTRLALVGTGPYLDALRELAAELGLEGSAFFVGPVAHEKTVDYYAAADLFLFSSASETQGVVLIEAMASGTPIVALEAPGSRDVLSEGGGVLVRGGARDLAETTIALLKQPGRRAELGEQGRESAERFSVSNATDQLLEAYAAALEHAPGGAART